MAPREIVFDEAAREGLRRGADALAQAVRVTLGPRGRTVILEREFGGPQIVNSGVVVARSIELSDRLENLGAQLLREVAARTSEMAGDGTTTATVLAHSMIHEGLRCIAGGLNPMELRHGMEQAIDPGPPVTGNGYASSAAAPLPHHWPDAIERFANSKLAQEYFTPRFVEVYTAVKRAECQRFFSEVTSQDYDWYLEGA